MSSDYIFMVCLLIIATWSISADSIYRGGFWHNVHYMFTFLLLAISSVIVSLFFSVMEVR